MRPKFAPAFKEAAGLLKFTLFSTLNTSARNCNLPRRSLPGVKFLNIPMSAVAELGLTLGQAIEVVKHDPAIPSWTIQYGTGEPREVPHELADLVLVQLESPP